MCSATRCQFHQCLKSTFLYLSYMKLHFFGRKAAFKLLVKLTTERTQIEIRRNDCVCQVFWSGEHSRSQSYKNLISLFFRFLLLSLSVCSIRQYCLCYKMVKVNSKKSLFYEEKSLVGLTPGFILDQICMFNRWSKHKF